MLRAAEPVSMEAAFSFGHLLSQPGSCRVIMGNESFALRGKEAPAAPIKSPALPRIKPGDTKTFTSEFHYRV